MQSNDPASVQLTMTQLQEAQDARDNRKKQRRYIWFSTPSAVKGRVHPKVKMWLLSARLHVDGKLGEVL